MHIPTRAGMRRWWVKRSREAGIVIALSVSFGFVIFLSSYHGAFCQTAGCERTRNFLYENTDFMANPCEDFFDFTCGTFVKLINSSRNWYEESFANLTRIQKRILNTDLSKGTKNFFNSTLSAIRFHKACLDGKLTNRTAFEDLFPDRETMFDELFNNKINWTELMIRARDFGTVSDFFLNVTKTFQPEEFRWIIKISVPKSPNAVSIFTSRHRIHIKSLLELWRSDSHPPTMSGIDDLIGFARDLNTTFTWATYLSRPRKTSIGSLPRDNTGFIPSWLEFLKRITKIDSLTENDTVIYDLPQAADGKTYFNYLNDIMTNREANHQWFDYVSMLTIIDGCWFLDKKLAYHCSIFTDTLEREFCTSRTYRAFPGILQAESLRMVATKTKRAKVKEMFEVLRSDVLETVDATTFVSDRDKKSLIDKIKRVELGAGWTDAIFDPIEFEEYYGTTVELRDDIDVQRTYFALMSDSYERDFRFLKATTKKDLMWSLFEPANPSTSPSRYHPLFNLLHIEATSMTYPLLDPERPDYMNYATLGMFVAHEFINALGHHNSFFDNVTESIADMSSYPEYELRAKCVSNQYRDYLRDNGLNIRNPEAHNAENTADIAGARLAIEAAFKKLVKDEGRATSRVLKGVNLTKRQLLWVLLTVGFCANEKNHHEYLDRNGTARSTDRPFNRYRVVSAAMNSPEFAEDFRCKSDQKMNPETKCQIFGV